MALGAEIYVPRVPEGGREVETAIGGTSCGRIVGPSKAKSRDFARNEIYVIKGYTVLRCVERNLKSE